MAYLISFLEGITTFISPCLLPLLPVYISFFSGQNSEGKKKSALINALGFVLGFTLVFLLLGVFAGSLGSLLKAHGTAINLISGAIVILFGLNYMGLIRIPWLNAEHRWSVREPKVGFWASLGFGLIFSVGWTPCIGAFLGSALIMAASSGSRLQGMLMLLSFSLGLGLPFLASALLIDRLKSTLAFIKRHRLLINRVSGGLLVLVGLMMASGLMGYFLALLTY